MHGHIFYLPSCHSYLLLHSYWLSPLRAKTWIVQHCGASIRLSAFAQLTAFCIYSEIQVCFFSSLLIYHSKGARSTFVTTRMLAKQFNQLIHRLNLPPSTYTLHSLRKGGATLCHSLGIPVDQIKSHGTWSSNTVWSYLNPSNSHRSNIANAMSAAVSATVNK